MTRVYLRPEKMPEKIPEKMREYHMICSKLKILMNLKSSQKNFIKKVNDVLPFASKNFEKQTEFTKKRFFEKEIEKYFVQNFEKCKKYLLWKKNLK